MTHNDEIYFQIFYIPAYLRLGNNVSFTPDDLIIFLSDHERTRQEISSFI